MNLTKKDLESISFKYLKKDGDKSKFINKSTYNRDEKIYLGKRYENKKYVAIENNCGQFYFMGWLKNIKELKIILNQVLIEFQIAEKG